MLTLGGLYISPPGHIFGVKTGYPSLFKYIGQDIEHLNYIENLFCFVMNEFLMQYKYSPPKQAC